MSVRSLIGAVVLLILTHAPTLAWACAVCSAGRDEENRAAYSWMTAFMTLMPLIVVGGFILWLRRRFRQLEERERAELGAGPRDPQAAPALR